jgi:RNA polymerase sigma factor (sigma-70 family)
MIAKLSDQELLRQYAEQHGESAFADLVQRHVDAVYSAVLRIVRDRSMAEDLTQQVFLALAANASKLSGHPALCGWLHRTARNLSAKALRTEARRRKREDEAVRMQQDIEPDRIWTTLEAHLDEALCSLSDQDRDAVLLRFFHGQSAREIADIVSITEAAAQKRVNRALERLRRIFERRGVTVAAQALGTSISAHSISAAPAGLASSISSLLAKTVIRKPAFLAATEAFTMTTMQKTIAVISIAAAVGAGVWEARQSSVRRTQIEAMEQRSANLAAKAKDAQGRRDEFTRLLNARRAEVQHVKDLANEAPKLREEISRIRRPEPTAAEPDPGMNRWLERVQVLKGLAAAMPDKAIPELALLKDDDWIEAARKTLEWDEPDENGQIKWYLLSSQPVALMTRLKPGLSETEKARLRFQELRGAAKLKFGVPLIRALISYAAANEGRIPNDITALKPYFATSPDDAMLRRYEVRRQGLLNEQSSETVVVAEKNYADPLYDTRLLVEGSNGLVLQPMIEAETRSKAQAAQ